jgi:hypothetical protein|tara:strand:+ start:4507 stop:5670 length:1164 start_codon:yes stop_codon:yes gene_type:complete
MKVARPLRLGVSITLGLVLAVALGAQSAGIALTKKAPDTAIAAFPLNGLAYENIASAIFLATTEATGSPEEGAKAARPWALEAYRIEPLLPKAHAILALAEDDPKKRKQILDAALALNRREPRLQAVVLQQQVGDADYPAAIASLDRILRVKPSQYNELFPVLINVFAQEGAIDEFAKILDGSSEWHGRFFRFAASQPSALRNLAELRDQMSFDDEVTDQTLLRNLVREGDIVTAYSLYQKITGTGASNAVGAWSNDYPPFDWSLTDLAGLRAQPSLSGKELEISVKPGKGGVVARRFVRAPERPFSIVVEHSIDSQQALQDIDVLVKCAGQTSAILEANLARQGNGYRIDNRPSGCAFIEITIAARAWSGRSALNENIEAVDIVQR